MIGCSIDRICKAFIPARPHNLKTDPTSSVESCLDSLTCRGNNFKYISTKRQSYILCVYISPYATKRSRGTQMTVRLSSSDIGTDRYLPHSPAKSSLHRNVKAINQAWPHNSTTSSIGARGTCSDLQSHTMPPIIRVYYKTSLLLLVSYAFLEILCFL